jgi:hypothetical protein
MFSCLFAGANMQSFMRDREGGVGLKKQAEHQFPKVVVSLPPCH